MQQAEQWLMKKDHREKTGDKGEYPALHGRLLLRVVERDYRSHAAVVVSLSSLANGRS
ncbi:hypothetical protein D3C84_1046250 [compost metagenome]